MPAVSMPVLRLHSQGEDVKLLQQKLTEAGFPTKVDGDFGTKTEDAVKSYQRAKGLRPIDGIVGGATWGMLLAKPGQSIALPEALTEEAVLAQFKALGHKIIEDEYVLNLFGIRSKNPVANSFDDYMGCFVKVGGKWEFHFWAATTDPGTYWLQNPTYVSGTAMLVEGQYSAWKIDKHQGVYEALCQRAAEVRVYRDADRDNLLEPDPKTIVKGYFGINLHRSSLSGESKQVDKWSAGCQVHARLEGFNEMMTLAKRQVEKTGEDVFTYTLLRAWW